MQCDLLFALLFWSFGYSIVDTYEAYEKKSFKKKGPYFPHIFKKAMYFVSLLKPLLTNNQTKQKSPLFLFLTNLTLERTSNDLNDDFVENTPFH